MASSDNHFFDIKDAQNYGIHEAVFLQNITYWAKKNKANGTHHYDVDSELYPDLAGEKRYFTFNSVRAFQELFPYMTNEKIRSVIKNLCEKGALIKGNYNKSAYDRTIWYALFNEKCIGVNDQAHLCHRPNGFVPQTKPIPDINTNINSDINIIYRTIALLNEKSKSQFKPTSIVAIKTIKSRLTEGFTETDLSSVIVSKCNQWIKDEKMCAYLRPETLFGNKFEGYLNESLRAASRPKTKEELYEERMRAAVRGNSHE